MKKYLFCVVIFILSSGILLSASDKKKVEKIKVSNVEGYAVGSEKESIAEVKSRAISDAKIQALKKAGISENIKTYTDYFQTETKEQYEELFSSSIFTDIQGAVKDVEVININRSFTEEGMLEVRVTINCTVLKYKTEEDLTFDFWVKGINPNYDNNSQLHFSLEPASDGYMRVFIFTSSEAYKLYPNDYEGSQLFKKGTTYDFPMEFINYTLETGKRSELHRIVFVFLKEDIPYTDHVAYDRIFDWIFSIPPDTREIKSYSFTVFNKSVAE